jgi:hypothetical protein
MKQSMVENPFVFQIPSHIIELPSHRLMAKSDPLDKLVFDFFYVCRLLFPALVGKQAIWPLVASLVFTVVDRGRTRLLVDVKLA